MPIPLSSKEAAKLGLGKKRSKYGAVKTVVDGLKFDSRKEANRYGVLRVRELAGEIATLQLQPKLAVNVNGKFICNYIADFAYQEHFGNVSRKVFEDVKSEITRKLPMYRLKKKLVEAIYGIEIREI